MVGQRADRRGRRSRLTRIADTHLPERGKSSTERILRAKHSGEGVDIGRRFGVAAVAAGPTVREPWRHVGSQVVGQRGVEQHADTGAKRPEIGLVVDEALACLLYTSPSPR